MKLKNQQWLGCKPDPLKNYVKFEIEVIANRKKEAERIREEERKKREEARRVLLEEIAVMKEE